MKTKENLETSVKNFRKSLETHFFDLLLDYLAKDGKTYLLENLDQDQLSDIIYDHFGNLELNLGCSWVDIFEEIVCQIEEMADETARYLINIEE